MTEQNKDQQPEKPGTNFKIPAIPSVTSMMNALPKTDSMPALQESGQDQERKTEENPAVLSESSAKKEAKTPIHLPKKGDFASRLRIDVLPGDMQAFLLLDTTGMDFTDLNPTSVYAYLNTTKLDREITSYNKINDLIDQCKKIQAGQVNNPIIQVLICQGTPPVQGIDGWIKYYHPHNQKVVIHENDKADFRNLDRYITIKQGDKIATMFMGVPGVPGKDVYGNITNPTPIKKPKINIGKNITTETITNPEEPEKVYMEYSAGCNGVLISNDETVTVSEELQINSNVGLSTGNISYEGSITVRGSIEEGAKVTCTGSLLVHENIESTDIEVGGDLIVKSGIKVKGKTVIRVKGNIKTKFIENAVIETDGDVIVDSFILNSKIFSLGSVILTGQNGSILGSEIVVYGGLSTTNLGSAAGVDILVEMGYHFRNEKLFHDLTNALKVSEKELTVLVPQIQQMNSIIKQSRGKIDEAKKLKYKQMIEVYQKKTEVHKKLLLKYDELKNTRFNTEKINLVVKGGGFPGVTIKYRRQIEKITVPQSSFMMTFFPGQDQAPMTAISGSAAKKK